MSKRITKWIDVDVQIDAEDVLPELDVDDLVDELRARGYHVQLSGNGRDETRLPQEDPGFTLRRDAERAYFAMHAGDMDVVRDFIADAAGRIQ